METGQLKDIRIEQAKTELHKLHKNQLFFLHTSQTGQDWNRWENG